jgi:hypothetical protein
MVISVLQLINHSSVKSSSSVVEEAEEPIPLKAFQIHGQLEEVAVATFDISQTFHSGNERRE